MSAKAVRSSLRMRKTRATVKSTPRARNKKTPAPKPTRQVASPRALAPLLVELLTEELPPKSLLRLAETFATELVKRLVETGFVEANARAQHFATPRRLAVLIHAVRAKQADRSVERRGPALKSALDANGQPTAALLGFAKSCGVDLDRLQRKNDAKGEYFIFVGNQKGEPLKNHLANLVEASLKQLPTPKLMRWGNRDTQFVRPVHSLIMLHGDSVIPGTVLGLVSGRVTRGHRFLSRGPLKIARADRYAQTLEKSGRVIASLEARMATIQTQLDRAAAKIKPNASWALGNNIALLQEVASIVEYPQVYTGAFDASFLEVPHECLIVSMQQHQKYFPVADSDTNGKLLPRFLFVSNIVTKTPRHIIHGNERVLKARLSDAKFFYQQDKKTPLAARAAKLQAVIYHNKLGTQLQRVERIQALATEIAHKLKLPNDSIAAVTRAAYLSKADLLTEMVGEFPELQGVMGKYYALHDGESTLVATAIEEHYFPKGGGGGLPHNYVSQCVALADKLDTLVGIYGSGLIPSGDKDPFGLRRQALGVVRILAQQHLALDLLELLQAARAQFGAIPLAATIVADMHTFMLERLKSYLRDTQGFKPDEIEAVLSLNPSRIDQILPRLQALQAFRLLPEAAALAGANKRIHNILRQAGGDIAAGIDGDKLREDAEKVLVVKLLNVGQRVAPLIASANYTEALKQLAGLREAVDGFFAQVMVMVEDAQLKRSRLGLLAAVRALFLQVADISKLQL